MIKSYENIKWRIVAYKLDLELCNKSIPLSAAEVVRAIVLRHYAQIFASAVICPCWSCHHKLSALDSSGVRHG